MGLYDDDDAAVTSGDQNNQEYWWSKYYSFALDEALKSRQPEGAIAGLINDYAIPAHDKALAKYAAHNDLKAWREKAAKIKDKITPGATGKFQPDFPWMGGPGGSGGGSFAQWWVAFHWAKCARDAGDWANCYENAKYCSMRVNDMTADRFKGKYSAEIQKFLADAGEEANALFAEAKKHR